MSILGTIGAAIAGPVVNGLFGSVGNAQSNQANLQAVRETNDMNYKIAQENNAYNYKLWQETNEYNSPYNQMQRLQNAGLNPALVYGNGSVVGNTSGQAPQAVTPHMEAFTGFQSPIGAVANSATDFVNNMLAIEMQKKQRDNLASNTSYIMARADTERKQQDLLTYQIADKNFDLGLKKEARDSLLREMRLRGDFAQSQLNNSSANFFLTESRSHFINVQSQYIAEQIKTEPYKRNLIAAQTNFALQRAIGFALDNKFASKTFNTRSFMLENQGYSTFIKSKQDELLYKFNSFADDYRRSLLKLDLQKSQVDYLMKQYQYNIAPIKDAFQTVGYFF